MLGRSIGLRVAEFAAAFVDGQFFMQARDHLADPGLGEAFGTAGMRFLQLLEAVGELAQLFLGFFVFNGVAIIRRSPLRPCDGCRLREYEKKNRNRQSNPPAFCLLL